MHFKAVVLQANPPTAPWQQPAGSLVCRSSRRFMFEATGSALRKTVFRVATVTGKEIDKRQQEVTKWVILLQVQGLWAGSAPYSRCVAAITAASFTVRRICSAFQKHRMTIACRGHGLSSSETSAKTSQCPWIFLYCSVGDVQA